ncbi:MAG TPA: polymorphic toxin-type HINT domain-containing protein, partial [Candidatus Limnocylindrales bacterium]
PDLAGSYIYTYTYNPDGSSATTRIPAMGDLGTEQLTHGYNNLGKPTTLDTSLGATTYVSNLIDGTPGTQYTSFGEVAAIHLRNNSGSMLDVTRTYETDTRRLAQIWTTRQTAPTAVADQQFSYDPAGNVIKISDLTAGDHQCFRTDHLRQVKEAWTPSDDNCNPDPTTATLGGPSKYWHSFKYDTTGSRTELVEHGTPAGDRTTNYTIPAGKHQLTGTSAVDSTGTKTGIYKYDASGNMRERPTPTSGQQVMTWDAEGHLATSTDATGTTSYIYDVDGNRLVRIDPTGKTLYLPGQELRHTSTGKKCTRYYSHVEQTVAMRTAADGVVWLVGDHHATAQASIKAVSQAISIRRETPFGNLRQTTGAWPSAMDKGFVGGTNDNTGLTHLGAREYDPLIGRFISVDPVIDVKDPQQMNGYNYANNGPMTASDPDGMWPKWIAQVANKVNNAVSNVTSTVTNAVKAAGTWVYDNAGTISTVLGVAAMACAVIPPLQVAAPFLGAAATAVGAIETYKTCKQGMSPDCAMGIAELVPGGRAIGALGKGAKYADDIADAAKGPGKRADTPSTTPRRCPPHSFEPRTPVLLAGGTTKAIEDITIGDKVVATDPETGLTEPKPVTALYVNDDTALTDVEVRDPLTGSSTTLKTTAHHPLWDESVREWVPAGELRPGKSRLRTAAGSRVEVTGVTNFSGSKVMRDLTVADIHTYYVLVGDRPVLVHNTNNRETCGVGDDGEEPDAKHVGDEIRDMSRQWKENNGAPDYTKLPRRTDRDEVKAQTRHPNQPPNHSEWVPHEKDAIKYPAIPKTFWGKVKWGLARFADIFF